MSRLAGIVVLALLFAPLGGVRAVAQNRQQAAVDTMPMRPPREPKRAEREQIEQLEKQFQDAQLSGDVATMDKLLSEDYLGINANGEVSTKLQQLDHMRSRSLVITQLIPSDVKIKLIGPTAIVTSQVQVEGQLDGSPLSGRYRYTRIYQHLPGGVWKVTNFEVTRIRRPG